MRVFIKGVRNKMDVDTLLEKLDFLDPEDEVYWIQLATAIKELPIEDAIKVLKVISSSDLTT